MGSLNPINKSFCLERLCESNFHKLMRLAPDLGEINETAVAQAQGKPSLHLRIIDRAPYTLTVELSHHFADATQILGEPAVRVRVYLDVRSAEVLCYACRPPARQKAAPMLGVKQLMNNKWSLNYFLEKWLSHCLLSGYCFKQEETLEHAV